MVVSSKPESTKSAEIMNTFSARFVRLVLAVPLGVVSYWLFVFAIDRASQLLGQQSAVRNLLEWMLAYAGPFGAGLLLIGIFISVAYYLLSRLKVPSSP